MYDSVRVRELFMETVFVNLAFQFPMVIQQLRLVCQLFWAEPINLNLLQIVSARRVTDRGRRSERGATTMVSWKQVTFLGRLVARVWKTKDGFSRNTFLGRNGTKLQCVTMDIQIWFSFHLTCHIVPRQHFGPRIF